MKAQLSKLALVAALGLALTFTLSCSGGDDNGGGDNSSSSSGIPDMCCPLSSCIDNPDCPDRCAPPILVDNEYVCALPNQNQSSSSSSVQSSSSGIPDMCCPASCQNEPCPDVCVPPVLVGNVYVCDGFSSGSPKCCPPISCYENPNQPCPPACAPPILLGGNEYVCAVPNQSSSSSSVQSSSSSVPDDCLHHICDEFGRCLEVHFCRPIGEI